MAHNCRKRSASSSTVRCSNPGGGLGASNEGRLPCLILAKHAAVSFEFQDMFSLESESREVSFETGMFPLYSAKDADRNSAASFRLVFDRYCFRVKWDRLMPCVLSDTLCAAEGTLCSYPQVLSRRVRSGLRDHPLFSLRDHPLFLF